MNKFDINLNLYRSFYYVAKFGGFTKASTHINTSQSSLSASVKNLEDLLNKKLFVRSSTDVTLTNYGRELYLKLDEIKNILDDELLHNELKIGCTRFIADNYLSDVVENFKNKNKSVKLSFNFANTTDMFQMLKKEELDLIICRYPMFFKFENYVRVEKIIDVENVFACSKDFYDKEKILEKDYIIPMILPDSSEKRRNIEQYLIDNNINYSVEIEIPNSVLLKKLILNGLGVGYINKKFIEEELKSGKLMILDIFKNVPTDNVSIVFNSKNINRLINEFVDIIKRVLKK
ncbi:MAG: LysR family transcriptional regulator [Mycoplasmatota bacterium]|nr:LysR family transcriptional regulator [Mycoplasmatota bacterium]